VKFSVTRPGEIVAVGNGDAASHEPFQAKQRKAFNGLCQVIVKAKAGEKGSMTLKAEAEGLEKAEIVMSGR
jgi:beta-galactosidase